MTTKDAIYTIGHSTRSPDEFVDTLADAGVRTLVDVRRYPHSRRQPWFNVDDLYKTLFRAGIRYTHLGDELGGFRNAKVDSRHTALAGSSFQGYADHMEGSIFARGYVPLTAEARHAPVAFMCSERNPKKCHRRMISDRLAADGWRVVHLLDPGVREAHRPTPTARLEGDTLVYRTAALDDFVTATR